MIASEDQGVLTVHNFEQELEDFLQEVPEMHDAMVSLLEARSKLREKSRTRGFWPVKFGGKDGKSGFKGKGRGRERSRETNCSLVLPAPPAASVTKMATGKLSVRTVTKVLRRGRLHWPTFWKRPPSPSRKCFLSLSPIHLMMTKSPASCPIPFQRFAAEISSHFLYSCHAS